LFNADNASDRLLLQTAERAAKALDLRIKPIPTRTPSDTYAALSALEPGFVKAVATTDDGLYLANAKMIADAAVDKRIALIGFTELAQAGALISYSANAIGQFRRAPVFIDKIIKGARPADIPVEQPTKFELVINLITAKALGLTIPPMVLGRADKVIE
jgi:putative ABC transport system substrate-binding protein